MQTTVALTKSAINGGLLWLSYRVSASLGESPASWAVWSLCGWLLYVNTKGWNQLTVWDRRHLLWATASMTFFLDFLYWDPSFQDWGDVYYFCGERFQYCTCDFRWNLQGWGKAAVLWSFILSSVLGLHKLIIQLGLDGLLPGEEMVTKESFISICWRLIPYWLNNWEQQWGAECSSMMFELPHFAVELLLVLPCVQIICSRLKLLALPHMRVAAPAPQAGGGDHAAGVDGGMHWHAPHAPPQQQQQQQQHMQPQHAQAGGLRVLDAAQVQPEARQHLAANVLKGFWQVDPSQRQTLPRLKANTRMMLVITCITALAAVNALYVPLHLEQQISIHARTTLMLTAHAAHNASAVSDITTYDGEGRGGRAFSWPWRASSSKALPLDGGAAMEALHEVYRSKGCSQPQRLIRNIKKHASEIDKMTDVEHLRLIPLVEAALALMRLSCEKFFVLVSVYVSYLLFQDPPGEVMRFMIRLNARLSMYIQKTILYCFPAICWVYNAGFIFSSFVSFVFWGGAVMRAYESVRRSTTVVRPSQLREASADDVDRMGGSCAICWGDMGSPGGAPAAAAAASGKSLPCGHAFHEACLVQWLHQCHGQGRTPTCPMCQVTIAVEVRYQVAALWTALWRGHEDAEGVGAGREEGPADGPNALQREIQALIEDADPVPFVPEGFDAQQEWQQQAVWAPPAAGE